MVFPFFINAQTEGITNFWEKYSQHENATEINITGGFIKFMASFAEDEEADIAEKIMGLRVLVMDEGNIVVPTDFKKLVKEVKRNAFEELMTIRDGSTTVDFMIREKDDTITDVLILVNDEENFVLLSLECLLQFSDLNKLNIEVEGGDFFKKIPEKKKDIPRA